MFSTVAAIRFSTEAGGTVVRFSTEAGGTAVRGVSIVYTTITPGKDGTRHIGFL